MLALVAVLAAYSGYAAAKWSTKSSVTLATASTLRTKASRADLEAVQVRTLDAVAFNAWFGAFITGDTRAQRLAEKRFRPEYLPAFRAWLATDPSHNPNAPKAPGYMRQYVVPQATEGAAYDRAADAAFTKGNDAGSNSDKYVRVTVFFATILFLVGIASHFKIRQARYVLIGIGCAVLVFSVAELLTLPGPPA